MDILEYSLLDYWFYNLDPADMDALARYIADIIKEL